MCKLPMWSHGSCITKAGQLLPTIQCHPRSIMCCVHVLCFNMHAPWCGTTVQCIRRASSHAPNTCHLHLHLFCWSTSSGWGSGLLLASCLLCCSSCSLSLLHLRCLIDNNHTLVLIEGEASSTAVAVNHVGSTVASHRQHLTKVGEVLRTAVGARALEDDAVLEGNVGQCGGDNEYRWKQKTPKGNCAPRRGQLQDLGQLKPGDVVHSEHSTQDHQDGRQVDCGHPNIVSCSITVHLLCADAATRTLCCDNAALLLQGCLHLVELLIRHNLLALCKGHRSLKELLLLRVQDHHLATTPQQLLLEQLKLLI
mmetsp:Transcript_12617/g.27265  ORF Transcript_12617/g.27265 Transcript_12617/m.27265 type:complete len:310 (+) Transcript_12617:559-1488(+)